MRRFLIFIIIMCSCLETPAQKTTVFDNDIFKNYLSDHRLFEYRGIIILQNDRCLNHQCLNEINELLSCDLTAFMILSSVYDTTLSSKNQMVVSRSEKMALGIDFYTSKVATVNNDTIYLSALKKRTLRRLAGKKRR